MKTFKKALNAGNRKDYDEEADRLFEKAKMKRLVSYLHACDDVKAAVLEAKDTADFKRRVMNFIMEQQFDVYETSTVDVCGGEFTAWFYFTGLDDHEYNLDQVVKATDKLVKMYSEMFTEKEVK